MKFRYISILVLLLSVLSASADKKMTIRNSDTGESFEVSVPDGLKIYEYNSNWLDSIPYLVERARYGEPWAYKALGDCYRHGKGGAERSIFKALAFYEISGIDTDEMLRKLIVEKPTDYLSLTYKLVFKIERKDNEGLLCVLDTLKENGFHDADVIKNYIDGTAEDSLSEIVENNICCSEIGTDKMMFTLLGCFSTNWLPESLRKKDEVLTAVASKFPHFYDAVAVKFLRNNHEGMDSTTIAEKTAKAIGFLEKADKKAVLSRRGAELLYRHYLSEYKAGCMFPEVEEMKRLATLARLPESEKFIFTD